MDRRTAWTSGYCILPYEDPETDFFFFFYLPSRSLGADFLTQILLTWADVFSSHPRWHSGKNLPANAGDTSHTVLIPGLGRYPGVENSNPLQYSCM